MQCEISCSAEARRLFEGRFGRPERSGDGLAVLPDVPTAVGSYLAMQTDLTARLGPEVLAHVRQHMETFTRERRAHVRRSVQEQRGAESTVPAARPRTLNLAAIESIKGLLGLPEALKGAIPVVDEAHGIMGMVPGPGSTLLDKVQALETALGIKLTL